VTARAGAAVLKAPKKCTNHSFWVPTPHQALVFGGRDTCVSPLTAHACIWTSAVSVAARLAGLITLPRRSSSWTSRSRYAPLRSRRLSRVCTAAVCVQCWREHKVDEMGEIGIDMKLPTVLPHGASMAAEMRVLLCRDLCRSLPPHVRRTVLVRALGDDDNTERTESTLDTVTVTVERQQLHLCRALLEAHSEVRRTHGCCRCASRGCGVQFFRVMLSSSFKEAKDGAVEISVRAAVSGAESCTHRPRPAGGQPVSFPVSRLLLLHRGSSSSGEAPSAERWEATCVHRRDPAQLLSGAESELRTAVMGTTRKEAPADCGRAVRRWSMIRSAPAALSHERGSSNGHERAAAARMRWRWQRAEQCGAPREVRSFALLSGAADLLGGGRSARG
jgi:hypothetical protein